MADDTRFTAFYTPTLFWAGVDPGLPVDAEPSTVAELIREVTFRHSDELHTLYVMRDGMVALRVHELEAKRREATASDKNDFASQFERLGHYLDYCNALALLLLSSMSVGRSGSSDHVEVSKERVSRVDVLNGRAAYPFYPSPAPASIKGRISLLQDPRTAWRFPYPQSEFDAVAKQFAAAVAEPRLARALAGVSRATAQYYLGNFGTAVALAWLVIETEVNRRWEAMIGAQSGKRLKKLRGFDYTISIRTEMLELQGRIQPVEYAGIEAARKVRNDVMHVGNRTTEADTAGAIRTALSVALADQAFSVSPPLELCVRGDY